MIAALLHLVGAQSDGHEHVGWRTEDVSCGQHTDDRVARAAQGYLFVDDRRVGTEATLPQAVTYDADRIGARTVFFRCEAAPHGRSDAEHVEELRRHSSSRQTFRRIRACQIEAAKLHCGDPGKDFVLLAPIEEVRIRDGHLRHIRAVFREPHEFVGVCVR